MANKKPSKQYWASDSAQTCVTTCRSKERDYYNWLMQIGRLQMMRRSWIYYNQAQLFGTSNYRGGEHGEYNMVHINEYRNNLALVFNSVISQRPSWEPRATNSDAKSLAQCKTARNVLDNIMRTEHLDKKFYRAVEYAGTVGEGFVRVIWDALAGKEVIPSTSTTQPVFEGKPNIDVFESIDVIRDVHAQHYDDVDWVIIRKAYPKYDLANRYPEHYDAIVGIQDNSLKLVPPYHYRFTYRNQFDNERVFVYYFYHNKTEACPSGREVVYINDRLILEDKPLAYRSIPVYRCSSGEMDGLSVGYSVAFDALPIQETMNALHSAISTNMKAFAVNNIIAEKGSQINEQWLAQGMNLIEVPDIAKAPKVLDLMHVDPAVYQYVVALSQKMEQIFGLNGVSKGQPPPGVSSGSALALVQTLATQFSQQLQLNYVSLLEQVGTAIIDLMKIYAKSERIIEITGKSNRSFQKAFKAEDIDSIDRVVADVGNPALNTIQGKFQTGQMLGQLGLLTSPEQLLSVLEYGTLDPLTDGLEADQINIERENEELLEGKEVLAINLDNHIEHIKSHMQIIADPSARQENSPVLAATLKHILQHTGYLQDPSLAPLLNIMGIQTPNAPGANPQLPPPGKGPVKPAQPQGQAGRPPAHQGQHPEPGKKPGQMPQLPNMPGPEHQPKQQFNPQAPAFGAGQSS